MNEPTYTNRSIILEGKTLSPSQAKIVAPLLDEHYSGHMTYQAFLFKATKALIKAGNALHPKNDDDG